MKTVDLVWRSVYFDSPHNGLIHGVHMTSQQCADVGEHVQTAISSSNDRRSSAWDAIGSEQSFSRQNPKKISGVIKNSSTRACGGLVFA